MEESVSFVFSVFYSFRFTIYLVSVLTSRQSSPLIIFIIVIIIIISFSLSASKYHSLSIHIFDESGWIDGIMKIERMSLHCAHDELVEFECRTIREERGLCRFRILLVHFHSASFGRVRRDPFRSIGTRKTLLLDHVGFRSLPRMKEQLYIFPMARPPVDQSIDLSIYILSNSDSINSRSPSFSPPVMFLIDSVMLIC